MGVVEQASASIEACLDRLEETYSSFSINQTTLAVSTDRYESIRGEDDTFVDVHAKIHNDDGDVLHVRDDQSLELPATRTGPDDGLVERVRGAVENVTGVSCRLDGVEQATIVGIRDADDEERETIYRLAVVFEGTRTGGTLVENAVWEPTAVTVPHA